MTIPGLMRTVRMYIKRHGIAITSAVLIYEGIVQIVSNVKYPIGFAFMHLVNALIEKGFRDHMTLITPPILMHLSRVRTIAIGVIVIVAGLFISLLADLKSRRALP